MLSICILWNIVSVLVWGHFVGYLWSRARFPSFGCFFFSSSGDGRLWLTTSWSKLFPESMLAFILFSTATRVLYSCSLCFSVVLCSLWRPFSFERKQKNAGKHGGTNPLPCKKATTLPLEIPGIQREGKRKFRRFKDLINCIKKSARKDLFACSMRKHDTTN